MFEYELSSRKGYRRFMLYCELTKVANSKIMILVRIYISIIRIFIILKRTFTINLNILVFRMINSKCMDIIHKICSNMYLMGNFAICSKDCRNPIDFVIKHYIAKDCCCYYWRIVPVLTEC